MNQGTQAAFVDALADHDVTTTITTADGVATAVADAIDPPAVGPASLSAYDLAAVESLSLDPSMDMIRSAATGVTTAALGIAEYGSIVIEPDDEGTEPMSLYPPRHVAILDTAALLEDLNAAFDALATVFQDGGDAVIATGPSATADMGELVTGAHGPREVHVVLLEDQP